MVLNACQTTQNCPPITNMASFSDVVHSFRVTRARSQNFETITENKLAAREKCRLIHLFAIEGGQSSKLFGRRSKTRHLTPQLVHIDWPMCVTFRRRLVSVRHWAYLQHCADGILHIQNSLAFILNGSSLCKSYWNFSKTTHANFGISQNRSSKYKTIVRSSDLVVTERTRPRSIACIVPRKLEPLFDQWPGWRPHHYVTTVVIKFHQMLEITKEKYRLQIEARLKADWRSFSPHYSRIHFFV